LTASFEGKVALVIGASRGMGRDTARQLAARGAHTVVSSRDIGACGDVADAIAAAGGAATALPVDIQSADSLAALMTSIEAAFGRLDMAFNNAGKILGFGALEAADPEGFDDAMRLNAGGVYRALSAQIPLMKKSGGGAIVINAALAGMRGIPGIGAYSAAKSAAIMLARIAAVEAGPANIRVNAIAPGYIATEAWMAKLGGEAETLAARVPLGRIGQGAEVADAVCWLLSAQASYINGVVLPIDGGLDAVF
tara:strand:- start:402 stop:1157 length:756 start_codon:yes stop_codon:yes gene_type:complete